MIKYQGEKIDFGLIVEPKSETDIQSWENITDIILYMYTNNSYIVKFRYPETSGYAPLSISNDKKIISGVLSSENTSKMVGQLYLEMLIQDHTSIEKYNTGMIIQPTNIKHEL